MMNIRLERSIHIITKEKRLVVEINFNKHCSRFKAQGDKEKCTILS